jgi:hypothetical protein
MSDLGKISVLTNNLADLGIKQFSELIHKDDNSIQIISSKDFQKKKVYSEGFYQGKNSFFCILFFQNQ